MTLLFIAILATGILGYANYTIPRSIQAGQINLNSPGNEPRSLSDIINFTQKSNLNETQLSGFTGPWEQALRTVNHYFGTSQIYQEGCTKYNCSGGLPAPKYVETASVAVSSGPRAIAVNSNTNRIYVANQFSNSVPVIDGNTNTVIATIAVGNGPSGIDVNPRTNRVYVANQNSGSVSVINATSNAVLTSIGVGTQPIGIGVNPNSNLVYVANIGSNSVSVINATSNTALTTIMVGAIPIAVAVNPTTNLIYVTNLNSNSVSVINGTSNTVLTTIGITSTPYGVAVNPTNNRVYVTNRNNGLVSVINGTSNTVITNISVRSLPFAVSVNPTSNRIYVTHQTNNTVSVIDGNTNTVLNSLIVGASPLGVAVNPTTNLAYSANQLEGTGTVSVIGQRPEIREACLLASSQCLVVTSTGTILPGTAQSTPVSLVAVSLRTNETKTGLQMALTVACDNNTTNATRQCFAFYVDGNLWSPSQTDLSKSPFIIQNAEPYFFLQWHWWDFNNQRIVAWGYSWYGPQDHCNWYWAVYWWWRTYANYYVHIWLPWWWWVWHWSYWRYWNWWSTCFST